MQTIHLVLVTSRRRTGIAIAWSFELQQPDVRSHHDADTRRIDPPSAAGYTANVRRLLVCVLGLLIVVISATDPVWCVDGCGRTGLTATNTAASGAADCPFCSGLLAPVVVPFTAEIAFLESVTATRVLVPVLLLTSGIERPPRA
jgi:hypothetical protein